MQTNERIRNAESIGRLLRPIRKLLFYQMVNIYAKASKPEQLRLIYSKALYIYVYVQCTSIYIYLVFVLCTDQFICGVCLCGAHAHWYALYSFVCNQGLSKITTININYSLAFIPQSPQSTQPHGHVLVAVHVFITIYAQLKAAQKEKEYNTIICGSYTQ